MPEILDILPYLDSSGSLLGVLIWIEIRAMRKESLTLLNRLDERVTSKA